MRESVPRASLDTPRTEAAVARDPEVVAASVGGLGW